MQTILHQLEQRLGPVHARQRLGMEKEHEARFGPGLNFIHPDNWYSATGLMRLVLKATGLYWLGLRNAHQIEIRHNTVVYPDLPSLFEGFTILQISDLHVEMNPSVIPRLIDLLHQVRYDICVFTGDFRGQSFGPFDVALEGLVQLRSHLNELVYAVLGNHDSIRMLPAIEDMGIRVLLNECEIIDRGDQRIHLAGVDDANYYQAANIEKAASQIPHGEFAVLLSHTPEIYRQAAYAGFKLMLSGHTHGGQICLPGSIPITLDAQMPRRFGSGPWSFRQMAGYTSSGAGASIVPVRFNCPPEITLHHLRCG